MKVLIIYGTRYGKTRLTAETMSRLLTEKYGHSVVVSSYKLDQSVKKSLDDFDYFIVGTSIVAGMWKSGVKRFLKKYAAGKRLAVFVTAGGTLEMANSGKKSKAEAIDSAIQRYIQPKMLKFNLKPEKTGAFGGQYGEGKQMKFNNWSREDIEIWIDELSKLLN